MKNLGCKMERILSRILELLQLDFSFEFVEFFHDFTSRTIAMVCKQLVYLHHSCNFTKSFKF